MRRASLLLLGAIVATAGLSCDGAGQAVGWLIGGSSTVALAGPIGLRSHAVATALSASRERPLRDGSLPAAHGAEVVAASWRVGSPGAGSLDRPDEDGDAALGPDFGAGGAGGGLPDGDVGLEPPEASAPASGSDESGDGPKLASTALETWVFAEPRWQSRRLGYLRAGAVVERSAEPVADKGCSQGWYRVAPRGYVCAGPTATTALDAPVVELSARRPDVFGLPYLYAMSRNPPPPLYARLAATADQRKIEPDRDYHARKAARLASEPGYVPLPAADRTPELLQGSALLPGLSGAVRGAEQMTLGIASIRSGFALLATYEVDGRRFGLTTELSLVPLDRTRLVRPSSFRGVLLSDELGLPLAFVRAKHAQRYRTAHDAGPLLPAGAVGWRDAVGLTGEERASGGAAYLQTVDGAWLRADDVVRVDAMRRVPGWAKAGRKWVDVSILKQALVAYEGDTPIYATLVSTGADGLGDPEQTHSTVQGTFLVHTKHLTVTMDGDDTGDEFDFADVPFVQYFTEGYALHGTYWHDDFGTPRSHGCVNLSPVDAAWLFRWTTPELPPGWHAALSARRGTVVHVHP